MKQLLLCKEQTLYRRCTCEEQGRIGTTTRAVLLEHTCLTSEVRRQKQLGPESGDDPEMCSQADRRFEVPSSQLLLEQVVDAEGLWPSCLAFQSC